MRKSVPAILFCAVLCAGRVATAAIPAWVPPDLEPWVPWVTEGQEYRECPFLSGTRAVAESDYRCLWPGTLELRADADGAAFSQSWQVVGEEQWVPLPGETEYWPEDVRVDGTAARVFERDTGPALRLGPGDYRVTGRFRWDSLPRALQVPAEIGLIALVLDGERVPQARRGESGLFLGTDAGTPRNEDTLGLQVYRLVEDAVPSRLTTRLMLEVAGSGREITVGPVLPPGFSARSLTAPFPARLEADGSLRLQVRPGRWTVLLVGGADTLVETIARPAAGDAWPATEIWSYRADDRLRVAVPSGMTAVDPTQAGVPASWQSLPAFAIDAGGSFRLEQRRRGGLLPENSLALERNLWLDFDGGGYTALDRLGGTLYRDWRLDMRSPYALLGARDSRGEPLLITESPEADARGVEWRERDVAVAALSRTGRDGALPVTGWTARVGSVVTTVHLPPGYRLGAAPGVDLAPGAWLDRWQLLDLFVVLLAAAAALRLYGRLPGLLALVSLVLIHQDLPLYSWLVLNLLAAVALARSAPEGRLRDVSRWYRHASLAALAIVFVPFAVNQVRFTLYPQLEAATAYGPMRAPSALPAPAPAPALREAKEVTEARVAADEPIALTGARPPGADRRAVEERYAPGAKVQTGPGIPAWRWNSYLLRWNGPVEPGQTMRLVILPRWLVAFWRMAMLGLGLAVLWWVGRDSLRALRRLRLPLGSSAAVLALLALPAALVLAPAAVRAEVPTPELLRELGDRLLRAPDCAPTCATIDRADVTVMEDSLEIVLAVNALETVAVPLPGAEDGWLPERVVVDGAGAGHVYRDPGGRLWLALDAGSRRVVLDGRLPDSARVEVAFPSVPRLVDVRARGWEVGGLRGRGLVSDTLELSRQRPADQGEAPEIAGTRFPAWLRVERTVGLGLDWSVTTRVVRVAPAEGAINVAVPLLPGEAVVSDGTVVRDGRVEVALGSAENAYVWRSTLARTDSLSIEAPTDARWSERWQFRVGSIWHANIDGVPLYASGDVTWQPVFLPLPGESLRLTISRPDAVEGELLAIDRAALQTSFGSRSSDSSLEFEYRSSLGGPHVIELPAGSRLTSLVQDGNDLPLPAEGVSVRIPTLPGSHSVRLTWRDDRPIGIRMSTPAVDLQAPSSNIAVSAEMPRNRWLLGLDGPIVGPAVLYWPALAALLLVALLLGRLQLAPLATWQWFLLGLGFSTFAWPAYALVVIWLLAMGWRGQWSDTKSDTDFRNWQIVVGLLSVVALGALVLSIPIGLLGVPDMHIVGNGSFGHQLNWFQDRSGGPLPVADVYSLPLWIYKAAILVWALWLAFALVRWLPWAWRCFSHGGIWRGRIRSAGNPAP